MSNTLQLTLLPLAAYTYMFPQITTADVAALPFDIPPLVRGT
jgi:hypothetical protein